MEASALQAPVGIVRSPGARLLRLRSDDQLVALFRLGHDDAFRVIHDRYRQRLFAYTRQMLAGSRSDAEDALQDVFLRAYGALRADDRPVTLRAWLYRVAHNRCVDQLRRPIPAPVDLLELSRGPLHDPLAEAERREDLRRLVADIRRLPDQQRSALLMREMEGLSYAELSDALRVTVPAVKSLLVRARIGLVEAAEARSTECGDIREDLALSFDKGTRASGRARRHLRDCAGCRDYRQRMRGTQSQLGALTPSGSPVGLLAKVLGISGAGSGAAAGTGAAGGGVAAIGGGTAISATKIAAIVCGAAITAGSAVEVRDRIASPAPAPAPALTRHALPRAALAPSPAPIIGPVEAARPAPRPDPVKTLPATAPGPTADSTLLPATDAPATGDVPSTGGLLAPAEDVTDAPTAPATSDLPTVTKNTGSSSLTSGSPSSTSNGSATSGSGSSGSGSSGSGSSASGSSSTSSSTGSGSAQGGSGQTAQGASVPPGNG